jgi:7,8-dihydropterin-6-yl-methyl-4-(beta-D-ribofuranosyl)aminobenzene 5'-phosphate synthase
MKISVTLLVENTARGEGILGEHGLAWWITAGNRHLLFDTGQGMALENNARVLGIDLSKADAIVLSHGHYDHVGGLEAILSTHCPTCPVWAHPASFERKYSANNPGTVRCISVPLLHDAGEQFLGERYRNARAGGEAIPEVFVTGEVYHRFLFEDTGGAFYLDAEATVPDPIADDMSIYFDTPDGLVIILGCAHAGVLNTLSHIRQKTGGRPVHTVMGGMHLELASADRMERTIRQLREEGIREIYPCHCTGYQARIDMAVALPPVVRPCAVGSRWTYDTA